MYVPSGTNAMSHDDVHLKMSQLKIFVMPVQKRSPTTNFKCSKWIIIFGSQVRRNVNISAAAIRAND
jgi:hypothetical protein